jgi:3-oxoacyl-[acyl-carrier-protein] synthase III
MTTPKVQFAGIATYLPERVVTNHHFEEAGVELPLKDDVFYKGVRERRWAAPGETSVDMGVKAGRKLLEQQAIDPGEIDLIIASALVNDLVLPYAACGIQYGLGTTNATAITLDTGCASFVSGLIYGSALIRSGFFRTILLISISNFAGRAQGQLKDRSALIPGDGAAALLMRSSEGGEDGLLSWWEKSFGEYHGMFAIHALTHDHQRRAFWEPHDRIAFSFDKELVESIKKNASELIPLALKRVIEKSARTVEDLDLVLTHQPNRYLIDYWRDAVGTHQGQVHDTLERYGNLFQASIPVTLDDAIQKNKVKPGDSIAMASFALAGELVSAAVIRWK